MAEIVVSALGISVEDYAVLSENPVWPTILHYAEPYVQQTIALQDQLAAAQAELLRQKSTTGMFFCVCCLLFL